MSILRPLKIITISFALVGFGFLVAATVTTLQTRSFIASANTVPGLVVNLEPYHHSTSRGHTPYNTVFTFTDNAGQSHTNRTTFAQYPPPFQIGSQVAVLFQTNNPESAQIKSFRTLWIVPTLLFTFGFGFAGIGILAYFSARKTYGNA
jgi:Protein of unknown function (DUF3592)